MDKKGIDYKFEEECSNKLALLGLEPKMNVASGPDQG